MLHIENSLSLNSPLQFDNSNRGTWKIIQSQRFLKTKLFKLLVFFFFFFAVGLFEGCFLGDQVSSNIFKVFKARLADSRILLVRLSS